MRLRIYSDLHLEHLPNFGKKLIESLPVDGDEYLVLAGDIFPLAKRYGDQPLEAVQQIMDKGYKGVIFVPGNHEFYWTSLYEGKAVLDLFASNFGLTVLRTGEVTKIEDQRFIGDTMWFAYHPMNRKLERHFSDFKLISDIQNVYQENLAWKQFFSATCQEGDIVVTHHLPSYQSVATEFIGDSYNRFFLSSMTNEIMDKKPKMWIHGHTHHQFDYKEGATRIIANPRGYPFESSQANWKIDKVVEI